MLNQVETNPGGACGPTFGIQKLKIKMSKDLYDPTILPFIFFWVCSNAFVCCLPSYSYGSHHGISQFVFVWCFRHFIGQEVDDAVNPPQTLGVSKFPQTAMNFPLGYR